MTARKEEGLSPYVDCPNNHLWDSPVPGQSLPVA
jgi:hypothetical protein